MAAVSVRISTSTRSEGWNRGANETSHCRAKSIAKEGLEVTANRAITFLRRLLSGSPHGLR